MPAEPLTNQQILGLILLFAGGVLIFLWALFGMLESITPLLAGLLSGACGSFLLDWQIALLVWGMPVAGFSLFALRQASYAKHFPVFSVPPLETVRENNGFTHHLHLREWQSRFIIGVDYEEEIDGTVSRQQTRWKDRFASRESAEAELRRRFADWQKDEVMRGRM